ncbi:hypothetical protein JCM10450v2_003507 [Rhodotorula kratochvilovae]
MSSERPALPSATSQKCLVCGAATTNVCSNCRKAGIDLHFCSAEHQKLVWSSHKRVCGPGKAILFLFPWFSPEEVTTIIKYRDWHSTDPDAYMWAHWPQKALSNLRLMQFYRLYYTHRSSHEQFWREVDPLQMISVHNRLCNPDGAPPSWYSEFHHLLLVYATLLVKQRRGDAAAKEAYVQQSADQVCTFVKDRIGLDQREVALALLTNFTKRDDSGPHLPGFTP